MTRRAGADFFGDVTGEYAALRSAAGVVTDWHDLVWVRGPDTVQFLDGLVSQNVESLDPGHVASSLLLAPQGKLRAPHTLLRGDGEVGLVADAGIGQVAAEDLRRFKIRVDVEIAVEEGPVVDVWGPSAASLVAAATDRTVPDAGHWVRHGVVTVASVAFSRVPLPRLVVAGCEAADLVAAGAIRSGRLAADAVRIEAGEPIMGVDVDERTIPQEGLLVDGAVDFTKGCYLGQELVARIDSRGHVNRMLRGVVIGENILPPLDAAVVAGGREVGRLTSVAESLERRAPVALALVRREVAPGAEVSVEWDGGAAVARVEALPLDRFGQ